MNETRRRRGLRVWAPVAACLAIVVPIAWLWFDSLLPPAYSVMDMGYADYGGGPQPNSSQPNGSQPNSAESGSSPGAPGASHAGHTGNSVNSRPITSLTADPNRPADVRVELTAAAATFRIGDTDVAGFTLNGKTPGPTINALVGQLIEVHLRNESVAAGVTLHWHGVDVPNAMDGVAGVTQDAVPVGGEYTYRFVVDKPGSYWYHSHQVSDPQVRGGLFGGLVVKPRTPAPAATETTADILALAHTYAGTRTINGRPGDLTIPAKPGELVRIRIANTDNDPMPVWANTSFRVVAVDGTAINQPGPVSDKGLLLAAGGRADLELTVPADQPARVQLSRATAVLFAALPDDRESAVPTQPGDNLDLLSYGRPAAIGFDPAQPDRQFDYRIGRRPGFVRGKPGLFWSINGHLYPDVPMFVVQAGDVVTMHLDNGSSEVHPMHLHGHHAVVLARNGVKATGSPWWVDSLDVAPGETYDIAFVADNPGIWMDHCHNLEHAADGMVAHLMYAGWNTPFQIGGEHHNQPE